MKPRRKDNNIAFDITMDDWTASALFSPSKARAQQAQAKDWNAVEAWLSKKYGSRVPTFERNEDTLQALLSLADLNESADEQRSQVEKIQRSALQTLSKRQDGVAGEILHAVLAESASDSNLDQLAEMSIALDCPNADVSTLGRDMVDLTSTEFELAQQVQRTDRQLAALKGEQARITQLLRHLKSEDFQAPADTVENTAEWARMSKQLKAKISEYEERLSTSRPVSRSNGVENLQRRLAEVDQQHELLASLEVELKAFQDLPADARSAKTTLEGARERLRRLTEKRDGLFESLADQ
ncbi:uncharacterized protein RCC_01122 [Ramularia collo-cygni]|uniref:HAUS augmin-like complex subunit 1 n=1 Tax=Ramularia collo-cygni TaxID=112498 RepID=A0A2D3UW35_9PEZI|nr:uncharacterized protein RCC_01122 [Ramularia collo-cygni]CZT15256.1 uncharacterized protein RCC_01122 [Ramularia collo-cygni]